MLYQFKNANGETVGTKATPNWIFLQENGFFGLCDFEKCEGVAINGLPYHLEGKKEIEGLETVSFNMISEEEYERIIAEEQQKLLDIISGEVADDENTDDG